MNSVSLRHGGYVVLSLLAFACSVSPRAYAQEKTQTHKAIDIDKALESKAPQNRGLSYYYFSLAKWNEDKGDLTRALGDMRNALKFNEDSSAIRVELAQLLDKNGSPSEALEVAQEAARLDPKDPEPHWLLANIYSRSGGRSGAKEGLRKAVVELETLRDISPTDERSYYALGGAYFELGEPEKAIQAYEKFQSLVTNVDAGYREIAKHYEKIANQSEKDSIEKSANYEKAIQYLMKAVEAQPNSAESLAALAAIYARLGKDKESIPVYKKLLELTGDNATVKRQLASALVDTQEYEEALKYLQDLSKSSPDDASVQILLGRAQVGAHKITEGIDTLKSLVKNNPALLEAEFYLGTAYEQNGQLPDAVKIFSGLLEKTKSSGSEEYKANRVVFQQHLAADYQEMGENGKAVTIYEDMLKGEATPNPRVLFMLINAYRVNRQLDKAISLGREQFEKNPKDTNIGLVYARALADANKTKEGAEILNKLLQADPSNVDIYVNLSQVYLQGKKYSDAEKVLRRAEDKKLDSERLKFQLATIYERQKDFDRAEEMFKEILKDNPKNAVALNYIGYMLADRGIRLQEAIQYVQEALEIDPNNGAYLDSLGWAFYKLNELDKAEKYLLQAVDLVKNDPVIHDHLGDLYYKTGDYQKARDFWSKSVSDGTEPEETQKVRE
ncbi:MAG TPA: tetratricopeptide repeat protein, partial [Acidobacteriota bacterium]|nr:tetratricopeptide repeat protein [Acidobacteriota bacterium]